VLDSKGSADVAVLRLEQLPVVFVLHLHLLDVRFRIAANGALDVEHAEQAGTLEGGKSDDFQFEKSILKHLLANSLLISS
jgi:hypothetical protein